MTGGGAHLNIKDARKLAAPTVAKCEKILVAAQEAADLALDAFRRAVQAEVEARLRLEYVRNLRRK